MPSREEEDSDHRSTVSGACEPAGERASSNKKIGQAAFLLLMYLKEEVITRPKTSRLGQYRQALAQTIRGDNAGLRDPTSPEAQRTHLWMKHVRRRVSPLVWHRWLVAYQIHCGKDFVAEAEDHRRNRFLLAKFVAHAREYVFVSDRLLYICWCQRALSEDSPAAAKRLVVEIGNLVEENLLDAWNVAYNASCEGVLPVLPLDRASREQVASPTPNDPPVT